ncbi:MAG: Asp-tRNA(Asn)/Glu-tRNA(Gln) amidotransferase subunit GatC [Rickettsiales bacterium]
MSITEKDVTKTAKLARLKIPQEKLDMYVRELSKILGVIDQLSKVDTDGVSPLVNVSEFGQPMRKDEVTQGNCAEEVLKNAPKELYEHFAVPKVIE